MYDGRSGGLITFLLTIATIVPNEPLTNFSAIHEFVRYITRHPIDRLRTDDRPIAISSLTVVPMLGTFSAKILATGFPIFL